MPTPPPLDHVRKQRKEMIETLLQEGYAPPGRRSPKGSAITECGRRFGAPRSTMDSWLRREEQEKASGRPFFLPDWSLFPEAKPKIKVPAGKELPPDYVPDPEQKPTVRIRSQADDGNQDLSIVAIGDAHDSPELPKDRFKWAGRFVADEKPDVVVQIGDMFTMNSINSYDAPGSQEFKNLPTYPDDIASGEQALTAFDEGASGYDCERHVTLGNHEDRVMSYQSRNPQVANMLQMELDRLLARHGWTYSPYSMPTYYSGVAFSHVPLSILSRPIGGELATQNIAQKSISDWVYGHSHRADVARRPKLAGQHVTAINLGCYLPHGHIENYVKHGSMSGWWYGLWVLRIAKGRIQSYRQHTVMELSERYG